MLYDGRGGGGGGGTGPQFPPSRSIYIIYDTANFDW